MRLFRDVACPLRWGYYVVNRPEAARLAKVAAFRDWLIGEAER